MWVESQAIDSKVQHYKVIDAVLGVTERGTWQVADAVREQPWLPNGPIPTAHLEDLDTRTVREVLLCNSLIGFNFGDGHLHNEDLITAVQRRCGSSRANWSSCAVESQAIHSEVQHYKVIDAALGVTERGTWRVANAVRERRGCPTGRSRPR